MLAVAYYGFGGNTSEMVGNDVRKFCEPETGYSCQQRALSWDGCRQNHVECGKPIGLDDQELVLVHPVNVPYLASVQERQGPYICFKQPGLSIQFLSDTYAHSGTLV